VDKRKDFLLALAKQSKKDQAVWLKPINFIQIFNPPAKAGGN